MSEQRLIPGGIPKLQPLFAPSRLVRFEAREAQHLQRQAEAELDEALEHGRRERARAKEDAEQIRSAVRNEMATERAAHERALVDEREAVLRRTRDHVIALVGALTDAWAIERRAQSETWARDLVEGAVKLARRLLDVEFELRPERVVQLAKGALDKAGRYRKIRILAHPDDATLLRAEFAALKACAPRAESLEIVSHPDIARPGVRLETEGGDYGAVVHELLDALEQDLRGAES